MKKFITAAIAAGAISLAAAPIAGAVPGTAPDGAAGTPGGSTSTSHHHKPVGNRTQGGLFQIREFVQDLLERIQNGPALRPSTAPDGQPG